MEEPLERFPPRTRVTGAVFFQQRKLLGERTKSQSRGGTKQAGSNPSTSTLSLRGYSTEALGPRARARGRGCPWALNGERGANKLLLRQMYSRFSSPRALQGESEVWVAAPRTWQHRARRRGCECRDPRRAFGTRIDGQKFRSCRSHCVPRQGNPFPRVPFGDLLKYGQNKDKKNSTLRSLSIYVFVHAERKRDRGGLKKPMPKFCSALSSPLPLSL